MARLRPGQAAVTADLTVFDYEGARVRVVTGDDGEPWFVASDVARILGYREAHHLTRGLDDDERGPHNVGTPGGEQEMTVVSEAGLYSAILRSRVETARPFRRWVTHEVLPAVRRHGVYATRDAVEAMLADPDSMIRVLTALREERASRRAAQAEVRELRPRAVSYDRFLSAGGDYSVASAAQALARAGARTGRNRLFRLLESLRWVYRPAGHRQWRAYQRAVDAGLVRVRVGAYDAGGEGPHVTYTIRVTPRGLDRLARHLHVTVTSSEEILS